MGFEQTHLQGRKSSHLSHPHLLVLDNQVVNMVKPLSSYFAADVKVPRDRRPFDRLANAKGRRSPTDMFEECCKFIIVSLCCAP
jgi:hypothetical protein